MRGCHRGRNPARIAALAAAFAAGGGFEGRSRGRHGGFGGPFGEGGGRRGKRFSGDELRLLVLGLLAQDAPQHGYQLIRSFAERSGDAYSPSPGVLYPLLTLLADMDLIAEQTDEGSARRAYALTAAGKAEVAEKQAEIDTAFARLAAMADQAGRADPAPVRRAMMNLRTAAVQRMTTGSADAETAFSIAEILDEAARKIERL
ncbi:PadR family transcriptional regulator [Novosphingobium kunmingense]|uniref:PadR family transcriptional regulator n=2 Tax=Novosphingobium kunmingense TaxID=1211806 RepID=A0A2N0H3A4_9SPHN|nr:PadR family transcriptional regulator [Novosphingobium kunmingense]